VALISPFSAAGPLTAEAEGLAALVVGWLSGSVSRQAGRDCAIPRRVRSSGTDIVSPPALMAALRRETRPGSIMTPFRTSGFLFSRQATPPLAWSHERMAFPCRPSGRDVAVSSMTRSGHRTAAPRSPCRNGDAATFFPWASPIPRGDKKVAALPSCAALRP
jgi:hypothetical protein